MFVEPLTNEPVPETTIPILQNIFVAQPIYFERPDVCFLRIPSWEPKVQELLDNMFEYYDVQGKVSFDKDSSFLL